MQEFEKAKGVIQRLLNHGYEGYFVGGSVRDYVMGSRLGDIDIATSATPEEVMHIFPKHIPIGLQHGTVLVVVEDESYEITTYRVEEAYEDHRRPTGVQFVRHLEEDLKRRDFTMNAMAMGVNGEIIDLFHGQVHIREKMLQTVGKASERFEEDALRMMRGIRFVSTLDFELSDDVKNAIVSQKQSLTAISVERITVEMEKCIKGKAYKKAFILMNELEMYKVLPRTTDESTWIEMEQYDFSKINRTSEFWTLLLHQDGQNSAELLAKNWRLSNKEKSEIDLLLQGLQRYEKTGWTAKLMYDLGEASTESLQRIIHMMKQELTVTIEERLQAYKVLPIKSRHELVVRGNHLLKWANQKPGPWINELLKEIETQVVEGELKNNEEAIRRWIETWQHH